MVSRLLQSDSPVEGIDKDEFAMNSGGVVYSGTYSLCFARHGS